jgi:hypothetical protein
VYSSYGDTDQISLDAAGNVYFDDGDANTIMRVDPAGHQTQMAYVDNAQDAYAIRGDGTSVYFALEGALLRGTPGQPIETLVARVPDDQVVDLAIDDQTIYWITSAGEVRMQAKSGGPVTLLATGQLNPVAIGVDDDAIYWANFGTETEHEPVGDGAVLRLAKP